MQNEKSPLLRDYAETRGILGNIGQTTLESLCNKGKLKKVKIGRRALVTAASINNYVLELENTNS
jgi:hypothetical protein